MSWREKNCKLTTDICLSNNIPTKDLIVVNVIISAYKIITKVNVNKLLY